MNRTTAPSPPATDVGLDLQRVPWRAVGAYLAIALGLAWIVMLPVWISGEGLASPLFLPLTAVMMYTPTVAALVATFFVLRPLHRARFLGLTMPRVGRTVLLVLLWPVVFTVLGFAAFFLAAAVGWVQPDFALEVVRAQAAAQGMPLEAALALTFGLVHVSMVSATLAAFGEELGWRGFLVAATAPLGFWKGTLLRGLVWGVWHAPIILLGYNFARPDVVGLLAMCGFTLALGVLLDWARYWTKSVWASAFGHGAINAVTPLTFMFVPANGQFDSLFQSVLGIPGWIVFAVVIGAMALVGAFRRSTLLPLIPRPRPKAVAPAAPGGFGTVQQVGAPQAPPAKHPAEPGEQPPRP